MQLLVSYILCFGILTNGHPFHVSVSEINFNKSAQTLEITHKIFLDDLENVLKLKFGEKVDLLHIDDPQKVDQMITAYLDENFVLKTNPESKAPVYLGREIEADAMWIYREVQGIAALEDVQVKNTILFDLFNDQINLVHVVKGDKIKSVKLTPEKKQDRIRFKK